MHINNKKEQFSISYVRAVASVAGFAAYKLEVDDDSVDLGLAASGEMGTVRSPKLDMQVKCTSREIMGNESLAFPLTVKNYNDLRPENVLVPRILIVALVPNDLVDWLAHSEEELLMRHCAYWMSLRGMGETDNQENITVHLPRNNQFTVEALTGIMVRIGAGGLP
jgi:hypothetical protein